MALFRSESEEARANAWLGRILLLRPLSFSVLTAAALAVALGLAGLFVWGEYTRKARVTGVLAPRHGVTKILAQQAGVVRELHVREGASVDRNQALLALVDARAGNRNEALGGSIERQLEQRRHALAIQRRHAVCWAQNLVSSSRSVQLVTFWTASSNGTPAARSARIRRTVSAPSEAMRYRTTASDRR